MTIDDVRGSAGGSAGAGAVVGFRQMIDGTRDDYEMLQRLEHEYIAHLPERLLSSLRALDSGLGGYAVSRYVHSLQSATRAERDGADVDWIVGALLHDIGDELAPCNHSQMAASIIRPYVRAEVTWVVNVHGIFQQHYYGHHIGLDPDAREMYRSHPWFDSAERFCLRWDQASFDPDYPTEPIEHFEPMLREVFARQPFDPAVIGDEL
ncbi:MAG: HD domain-containing protein [Ilumatobacteraceae bacterium]